MKKPIVAVTPGDAAGIGPEILAKSLVDFKKNEADFDLLVVCDVRVLEMGCQIVGIDLPIRKVAHPNQTGQKPSEVDLWDMGNLDPGKITLGRINPICGSAMVEDTQRSCEFARNGAVQAVVGGPHSKKAAQDAGLHFEGYPYFVQTFTNVDWIYPLLILDEFRVTAVTHHIALLEVSRFITRKNVLHAIQTLNRSMKDIGLQIPHLVVAGLNPHCGEGGAFGDEEITAIAPAVEEAKSMGIKVEGPLPADSLFFGIPEKTKWDAYLVMYHDQSHLPIKTVAFDRGCLQVIGSPLLFFTVCHGVAFDLAGQALARHLSLNEALRLAGCSAVNRQLIG